VNSPSGRPDLNRRPSGPKPDALPSCATSRSPGCATSRRIQSSSLVHAVSDMLMLSLKKLKTAIRPLLSPAIAAFSRWPPLSGYGRRPGPQDPRALKLKVDQLCARSSTGQSRRLLPARLGVRVLPGAHAVTTPIYKLIGAGCSPAQQDSGRTASWSDPRDPASLARSRSDRGLRPAAGRRKPAPLCPLRN
jgi:hypothetical protein